MSSARIYLLVGFFGTGKTTLIRKLLAGKQEERYAVIQNQFAEGEMGIEQPLIMDQSGTPFSSFLELPNGCICCSAKDDLIAAVQYIINNTEVRNIVVQTNGLADPASSLKQFWFDQEMNINAILHSVITMVSARKWKQVKQDPLFFKQLLFANKILISFLDVAGEGMFDQIKEQLRQINCEATVQRSDNVDFKALLHDNSIFNKQSLIKEYQNSHSHHHIRSHFLKGKCSIKQKLMIEQRIGELLWESGMVILRMKGVFCVEGEEHVLELQAVEDLFEVKLTNTKKNVYGGETRVLIVGQDLNSKAIADLLQIHNGDLEQIIN